LGKFRSTIFFPAEPELTVSLNDSISKPLSLKVKEILEAHKDYERYFESLPFNSGYFMCVRVKNLDADKVWEVLLNRYNIGVICYSEKNLLRIAFASTPTDKLEKLFNNIYSACKDCT